MAQSGPGGLRLFNEFTSVPYLLADTTDQSYLGDFYAGGEGFEDTDAGIAPNTALMGGVITLTSANTDADTSFIGTSLCLDVGLMGTLVLEARVQMPDFDTKEILFGITSILSLDEQLEDIVINASATAVTIVADMAGFYFSDELTASATEWHGLHAGGSAADGATAADVNLGTVGTANPTAGEWQVLRLEIDNNGTVRWSIDGVLLKTVVGAVSTTSDYAVVMANGANTTELVITEIDYILARANRDWTV